MEEQDDLKDYIVGSLPTLIYIPNFISDSEQTQLLREIYQVPSSKWKSLKNRRLQNWGGLVHEKGLLPQELPSWLECLTQKISKRTGLYGSAINHVLVNEYLPDQGIMPHQDGPAYFPVVAIISLGSPAVMNFTPHPKLKDVNEVGYMNGDKILRENALDLLNSEVSLERTHEGLSCLEKISVLLMPRSLLIFKDQAYSEYLHGIEESNVHPLDTVINISEMHNLNLKSDIEEIGEAEYMENNNKILHRTSTRVSLTCRAVSKVHRKIFKF